MLDTSFTFDGKYAKTLGIELEEPIKLSAPIPNIDTVTVPGRNGDLHFFDGSYANRTAAAKCFLCGNMLPQEINELNSFLFSSHGYRKLRLDEDDAHFLLARPVHGAGGAAVLGLLEAFTLTFDCKPQRFLTYGEDSVDVTSSKTIYNPTAFPSKPVFEIFLDGNITVTLGKTRLTAVDCCGFVYYDTELDAAYDETGHSLNGSVKVDGTLELLPGRNEIDYTAQGLTWLKIIPRWWEL